jgi:hypothetical protein
MKNFKQIAFGLIIGAMAIGFSAFTNAKQTKFAGTLFYNQATQQNWSSSGALPADQDQSHYTTVSGTPDCLPSTKICTYDLVNDQIVQSTEGTIH